MYTRRFQPWAVLIVAATATTASATAGEKFSLVSAVPDDVFICVAERHNPEREFLNEYWSDVFDAFWASGVDKDFWDLIAAVLNEEQQAEADRLRELATKLIAGVDWQALGGGQFTFGERMPTPFVQGSSVAIGPPDMVWLFHGRPGSAQGNYDGLVAIVEAFAKEINTAVGKDVLRVETSTDRGATLARLLPVDGPPFGAAVGLREDVILITVGNRMLDDVLDLLNNSGEAKSIAASQRYQDAFKQLPEAEDVKVFFDVQRLLASVAGLIEHGMQAAGGSQIENFGFNAEATQLEQKGIEAYRSGDYKEALKFMSQAHEIAPTDSRILYNLACMNALNENRTEALDALEEAVSAGFHDPVKIKSDDDLKDLRGDPRFKQAVAEADPMRTPRKVMDRIMTIPGIFDYVANVEYTDEYSVHSDDVVVLVPDARDNPFYPVVASGRRLEKFERYLPQETVSFSLDSGLDLAELYKFIRESFAVVPEGKQVWAQWEALQAQFGCNVKTDLIDWMRADCISVTLRQDGGNAWVWMIGVKDQAAAREKLDAAIEFVTGKLPELAAQQPMIAGFIPRLEPAADERLEGMYDVYVPMSPTPAVLGVKDDFLVLSSSEDALITCLETAAGQHPSVRENAQIMAEAVLPDGPFDSMSFSDERDTGKQIAMVLQMVRTFGGMAVMNIPDPKARAAATKVLGMVGKLAPVAMKIDFYKSKASLCTFDGKAWHCRGVTHYVSPGERESKPVEMAVDAP